MLRDTANIKHVLRTLETSTFSGVSRKTLLVVVSSVQVFQLLGGSAVLPTPPPLPATARVGLPDLIVVSCNGSRAMGGRFGQPKHCSALFRKCSRMIDQVSYKRSCLPDPSFLVVMTIPYIQERLLPIASISTFCNCRFCDAVVAYCRDQSHFFTLFMLSARGLSTPSWRFSIPSCSTTRHINLTVRTFDMKK